MTHPRTSSTPRIATYKESLSHLGLVVEDAAEELDIYGSHTPEEDASVFDRRASHRFAQSNSPNRASLPNGTSAFKADVERYKAEIQRLQASEAEINALSDNYAAILKDKEEELSHLHEENGLLRKSLETASAVSHTSRSERRKTLANNSTFFKGTGEQPSNQLQRSTSQVNAHAAENFPHRATTHKHDTSSNGGVQITDLRGDEKELAELLKEQKKSLATLRANYESEVKQLTMQLEKEREALVTLKLKLQGTQDFNESTQKELQSLRMEKERYFLEMKDLHNDLDTKAAKIKLLQSELNRRDLEESGESVEVLKGSIATLEKENSSLKAEKDKLVAALILTEKHRPKEIAENLDTSNKNTNEELLKLEKALKDTSRERDKALQELSRLKRHLLDKELEESEKMDEDSKTIEELQAKCEYQKAQISHFEKALKQALSILDEAKKNNSNELHKANEMIHNLKDQLAHCTSTVDAKNVELLNLETALGQYYAETEAKERLGRDLAVAKEESAKLSESLKDVHERLEISKHQEEEILSKLSQTERMLLEGKHRLQKLEGENLKLRRALEQSMTRLNRMSVDSDYFVDRRIVIKLLVTYFQRNHSKEVLDLMVRMLGFSEEDKQRIGFAQQGAGKSVVRGVLGLPGRLVGGILGGNSPEVSSPAPSENQSFADLWVDFLLKESEEREKRETANVPAAAFLMASRSSTSAAVGTDAVKVLTVAEQQANLDSNGTSLTIKRPMSQVLSPLTITDNHHLYESSDSEFSTVPLTSKASSLLENSSKTSRFPPR
ncbi:golgin candidate 4-like [Aristolochia californica]|uniref:golgin candidate 4-like n=1 Tax=Aristolochia californica TaxID=171875 RepID=UPI0035DF6851